MKTLIFLTAALLTLTPQACGTLETNPVGEPSAENLPVLIDLAAGKCIPCKLMAPILEKLAGDYEGIFRVVVLDVGKDPSVAKEYKIRVIPTQIFLDASGAELYRHEGFFSREHILATWEKFGVVSSPAADEGGETP